MPFQWQDFLTLAEKLAAAQGEAELRSSVSRAYFAAYGVALHYGERGGFERSGGADDHGRLRAHFQKHRNVGLAQRLHRLRENRNLCDYSDEISNLEDMVQASLREAHHILEHCNQAPRGKDSKP